MIIPPKTTEHTRIKTTIPISSEDEASVTDWSGGEGETGI